MNSENTWKMVKPSCRKITVNPMRKTWIFNQQNKNGNSKSESQFTRRFCCCHQMTTPLRVHFIINSSSHHSNKMRKMRRMRRLKKRCAELLLVRFYWNNSCVCACVCLSVRTILHAFSLFSRLSFLAVIICVNFHKMLPFSKSSIILSLNMYWFSRSARPRIAHYRNKCVRMYIGACMSLNIIYYI